MKKKIAIIAVLILSVIGFMFYKAIERNNRNVLELKEAGYIINSQKLTGNNNEGQIYYFNAETKYSKTYDNKITFKDTEGNTAKVPETSFVHYENNSIGVLKKAVVVNIEDILKSNLQYYNVFDNNLLVKTGDSYEFENLGHKIRFKGFIIKTDDNKYLIVSDGMKIVLDDGREVDVTDNYIELSIVDEKVVRLDNKSINLQTIGKESLIKLADDVSLNLDNHYIFKDKEPLFTLDQMIINSQDNINVTELEKEKKEQDQDVQYDENGNVINNDNENTEDYGGGGGGNIGGGGSAYDVQEETEVDETSSRIPTATIDDIEITSNKIRANIKINDDDSLMSEKTEVTITENSTGRHIYEETFDIGQYSFEISTDALEPNTTYNLTVRVHYTREDIDYVIDVISQLFTTEALGINIEKEYATSSELSYNIRFDDYSRARSCDVSIRNTNGDILEKVSVDAEQAKKAEGHNILFSDLEKNTKYVVVVDNILYDNIIIGEEYNIQTSAKTLKERPTFGGLSFSIDKKNSSFTLSLNNIKDADNGIETYRYELYDARTYGPDAQPIKTVEKQARGSVEIQIDERTIQRGVPYIYRVVTEFYDNEKYIEYITPLSDFIQMDGVEGARLEWTAQEVTFERIKGFITITDPSNTIDLNNQMTVIYTNSIGTTKQFTTAGNLIVPININNLRQNETYNIAIYATVDFQDGNGKVDSYYVGSVTVTTNPTKAFTAAFGNPDETSSQAFSISAQLQQGFGYDNTLEASTLTGITISLYEGRVSTGKLIKQVKLVDRDLREYYSDLKDSFYDGTITLNPAFFSLQNSDITSEYLTIMISDAYDYTDFKNEIEVLNNTKTIKANNMIPDLPQSPDDAIQTILIRNRNADAAHQDPNLDGDTIVGVKIKSLYDNTRHYAKYIDYSVYDAATNRKLDLDLRYNVPEDGTIDFIEYYFDYGTPYDTVDDELRRGNTYFFTYTAGLKLGTGDTITPYPVDDTVLKSKTIYANKQPATIKTYPSASNTGELTVKYTLEDLDSALYENSIFAKMGPTIDHLSEVSSAPIEITDTYQSATLSSLFEGYLGLYVKEALIKNDGSAIKEKRLSLDYFKNPSTLSAFTYSMEVEVNRLIFTVNGYNEESPTHQRIAGLKATFTSGGREIVKDYQIIGDNNLAVVDLFELAQFKGSIIKVKLEAYYDSNKFGYDLEGPNFAIQRTTNEYGGGNYYTIIDNQRLYDKGKVAMENIVNKVVTQEEIILASNVSGYRIVIPFTPDTQGFLFNYEYLNVKELATSQLTPTGSDEFVFDKIVPGIKLTDSMDQSTIIPEIRTVNISGTIYGFDLSELQNDLIYAEVYETDENGISMDLIKTVSVSTAQFVEGFVIEDLMPGTNYALKFYGNLLNDNGIFEKTYLYDIDANTNNRNYYFKTLSSVPITGMRHSLSFVSYTNKTMNVSYRLGKLVGYDRIDYELYKQGSYNLETGEYNWTKVNIDIPSSTRFTSIMSFDIDVSPGTPIEFGQRYRLYIKPIMIVETDNETHEVELGDPTIYTFNLRKLSSPTFSVRSTLYSEDDYITFTVSVFDTSKVIVGGKYSIKLTDSEGNDVTKDEYKNVEYSINNINQEFEIRNITPQELYTLTIYYKADMKNDLQAEQTYRSFTTRAINATGIDVGDISAGPNSEDPRKIDLTFSHSNKLDRIDTISYSVYNTSDGTSFPTVEEAFTPESVSLNGTIIAYKYTLKELNLSESGIYLIQMQFTSNDTLVSEVTAEYTYIK